MCPCTRQSVACCSPPALSTIRVCLPADARIPSPWLMTSVILTVPTSDAAKWSSPLHRLVGMVTRRSRGCWPHYKSPAILTFTYIVISQHTPVLSSGLPIHLTCPSLPPKVGVANWTDLQAAKDVFNRTDRLYYGGPLGDNLNVTIAEKFTPSVRLSDKNVTHGYLEVCAN